MIGKPKLCDDDFELCWFHCGGSRDRQYIKVRKGVNRICFQIHEDNLTFTEDAAGLGLERPKREVYERIENRFVFMGIE